MHCPLCQHPLTEVEYEGVPIHTCECCGGELIAGRQLGHIVRERQAGFDAELRSELDEHAPVTGIDDASGRRLDCPACHSPMQVVNYAHDSGIDVDRCPDCTSVWLDHAELEKVQLIMERWSDEAPQRIQTIAGELELARQKAAESTSNAFSGSRFSFVNAMINKVLDFAA